MSRRPWILLATASLQILAAGLLLGFLHRWPLVLAGLLVLALATSFLRKYRRGVEVRLLLLGTVLTLIVGTAAELWGTRSGYWTYHDLPVGRLLPAWVPVAWALAYHLIYGLEARLAGFGRPLLAATLICAWFPWLGEVAAIASGVWTYHWPWRLAGVPILAVGLLIVAHLGIYLMVGWTARTWNLSDPVYAPVTEGDALDCL